MIQTTASARTSRPITNTPYEAKASLKKGSADITNTLKMEKLYNWKKEEGEEEEEKGGGRGRRSRRKISGRSRR